MTLTWWQGLVLGLIQGLTEFLPISSSGHLVLAEALVGFRPSGLTFEIVVHVGTLLSVFVAYRTRIWELARGLVTGGREARRYLGLLALASVPATLVGLFFRDFFERTFHSPASLGWAFLFTAAVLWSTRRALGRATATRITTRQALLVGAAQAIAIVPAISRSGTTVAAALWSGVAPQAAAEFSFLMSIVVIAGAGAMEVRHLVTGDELLSPGIAVAFVAALVSGVFAIRFLVALLRRSRFHLFAPYCVAIGVFCLTWFGLLGK